jgi:Acetyltransferase (GNAT) domain
MADAPLSEIQFRRLTEADLPALMEWLGRPHVAERWDGCASMEELREEYLPREDDPSAAECYLAYVNDWPGARMLREFAALLFEDAAVTKIQGDPSVDNPRAIRCCEKAGFVRRGLIETPDGEALLMVIERRADRG